MSRTNREYCFRFETSAIRRAESTKEAPTVRNVRFRMMLFDGLDRGISCRSLRFGEFFAVVTGAAG